MGVLGGQAHERDTCDECGYIKDGEYCRTYRAELIVMDETEALIERMAAEGWKLSMKWELKEGKP